MNGSTLRNLACILAVGYIAFFYRLGDLKLVGPDESRYAEVAKEMTETGDFIVPKLDHQPWFEKPPLYYWLTALSFRVLGISNFSARVSSALLALLGALVIYGLGRKIFSARTGLLAALILSTSVEYFMLGRGASMDLHLSVMVTLGLSSLYVGLSTSSPKKIYLLLGAYLFFGLAVLAKGPIGVIIPALVILIYLSLTKDYDKIYEIHLIPGCVILLLIASPWYLILMQKYKFHFVASFFLNHNLARFFTPIHHHEQPFYYYFFVLLIGFFPWIAFLPVAIRRLRSINFKAPDQNGKALIFLWVWTLVPIVFFSFSNSKLPGYILPVIPALALLVGREWDGYLGEEKPDSVFKISSFLYVVFAVAAAGAVPYLISKRYHVPFPVGAFFSFLFLISPLFMIYLEARRSKLGQFLSIAMTILLFIVFVSNFVFRFIEAG